MYPSISVFVVRYLVVRNRGGYTMNNWSIWEVSQGFKSKFFVSEKNAREKAKALFDEDEYGAVPFVHEWIIDLDSGSEGFVEMLNGLGRTEDRL